MLSTYSCARSSTMDRAGRALRHHLAQQTSFFRGRGNRAQSHFPQLHSRTGIQPVSLLLGPLLLCHTLLLLHPICPQTVCFTESELSSIHAWTMAVAPGHQPPNQEVPCAGHCWRRNQGPQRPGACQTHTHTLSLSLSVGPLSVVDSWGLPTMLVLLLLLLQSTPGSPGRCCVSSPYHTSSSWSGDHL